MAQASPSIFNKNATERLRSPDDLDKYVQVTNPSVWVIMAACIAFLTGLLAWGVFGTVSTNVTSTGVVENGRVTCFVPADEAMKLHVGDTANVDGTNVELAAISAVPLSRDEASKLLESDYLAATLFTSDWCYQVTFEGDASTLPEGVPLTVSITTERVAPISLMLGGE